MPGEKTTKTNAVSILCVHLNLNHANHHSHHALGNRGDVCTLSKVKVALPQSIALDPILSLLTTDNNKNLDDTEHFNFCRSTRWWHKTGEHSSSRPRKVSAFITLIFKRLDQNQ